MNRRPLHFVNFALLLLMTMMLAAAPPSGRPPRGPLERVEPRVYEIKFDVTLSTRYRRQQQQQQQHVEQPVFALRDAPVMMPVILNGTYSRVDPNSLRGVISTVPGGPLNSIARRLDEGLPFHAHQMVMVIPEARVPSMHISTGYLVQSWSSRINEQVAQQVPWPRDMEWPDEVQDGLRPQMFIESDHQIFAETIARNGGDRLQTIPPYIAAKQIVRYVIQNIQVSGLGVNRHEVGAVEGLRMQGALATVEEPPFIGSEHDLLCVCIAMLRAANIPARPVIGIEYTELKEKKLVSWGEFFLPDVGWVPFDPMSLRGRGVGQMDERRPWRDFGTMGDLNRRIPLSYHFHPPVQAESPGSPAVWGWDPRPGPVPPYQQSISFDVMSRGAGRDDPR